MSMLNSSGSELERIRCRKCGCVFGIEGIHIGITTNRFFVPQMGDLKERRYKNENEQEFEQPHTLPYVPGDIWYVRETWQDLCLPVKSGKQTHDYAYKASDNDKNIRWRPSIHMPKAAARIWLKVTDVRPERLQDIDGQGVLKEGLDSRVHPDTVFPGYFDMNQREMFEKLWNSTIKKADWNLYGWDANPWVWVIEFERCKKPEEWSV